MNEIRILQLGTENWKKQYRLPGYVQWVYASGFTKASAKLFDMVFLDRQPREEEYDALNASTRAYTLYVTEDVAIEGDMKDLYEQKCGQVLQKSQVQEFLSREIRFYFTRSYGEKYQMTKLTVAEHFSGTVRWNGNRDLILQGNFGRSMRQAAFWRNNVPLFQHQVLDLWLEYEKDPQVEIMLELTQFAEGSSSDVIGHWTFDEKQLEQVVRIEGKRGDGPVFASVRAKGNGELRIIALHNRYSRGSHGYFLPGGVRYVTSEREEIFAYFDPGDRKPPLNVYFCGYKEREGFENYHLMRNMGGPFLLLSEARLEGGCFYMGSEEYETLMADVIRSYMKELDFTSEQMIFSGLSMGACGALYYGSGLRPHAVIIGKPLVSIGNVAANEKRLRPGVFPASLDVLQYLSGNTDDAAVLALNQKFWDKFDAADWSKTKFIVAYMLEDDYDTDGYAMLLEHLQSGGVQVYGKGIHGRQNDNTNLVVQWFISQYRNVLSEDFGREVMR